MSDYLVRQREGVHDLRVSPVAAGRVLDRREDHIVAEVQFQL